MTMMVPMRRALSVSLWKVVFESPIQREAGVRTFSSTSHLFSPCAARTTSATAAVRGSEPRRDERVRCGGADAKIGAGLSRRQFAQQASMHKDEIDDSYVVDCRLRRGSALDDEAFGTGGSNRMRRTGSTPGVLQRVPASVRDALAGKVAGCISGAENNETIGIAMRTKDVQKLMRTFGGRRGLGAAMLKLRVFEDQAALDEIAAASSAEGEGDTEKMKELGEQAMSLHVLPRVVHIGALSQQVENITMVVCQKDVMNLVEVPVNVIGSENSPGIKKGGYLNLIQYVHSFHSTTRILMRAFHEPTRCQSRS